MDLRLDLERVRRNVRDADAEDLLDRVTVFRDGMEPEALAIIEEELSARGISGVEIEGHRQRREQEGVGRDAPAESCSFCRRPAVRRGWDWHRLWGLVPVFPRVFRWCAHHQPPSPRSAGERGQA